MLVGLKGSGKTTTAAKLALHLRKSGARPLMVAADPYRVAASEQLQALGRQLGVPIYAGDGAARAPSRTARGRKRSARARPCSSSTRRALQVDGEMMTEAKELHRSFGRPRPSSWSTR